MNKKAFTLAEMMVVLALISIVMLVVAKVFGIVNKTRLELESQQIMRFESTAILSQIVHDIYLIGNGLERTDNIALIHKGTPVSPPLSTVHDFDSIFFFHRDNNTATADPSNIGRSTPDDIWVQYFLENGFLFRREFTNVKYTDSTNLEVIGLADPLSQALPGSTKELNSHLVEVKGFTVNFYASRDISITNPNSASSVRVSLELAKGPHSYRTYKRILLHNILSGIGE